MMDFFRNEINPQKGQNTRLYNIRKRQIAAKSTYLKFFNPRFFLWIRVTVFNFQSLDQIIELEEYSFKFRDGKSFDDVFSRKENEYFNYSSEIMKQNCVFFEQNYSERISRGFKQISTSF